MKKSPLTTEPEYLASFPLSFSALSVPDIVDKPEFGFVYGALQAFLEHAAEMARVVQFLLADSQAGSVILGTRDIQSEPTIPRDVREVEQLEARCQRLFVTCADNRIWRGW